MRCWLAEIGIFLAFFLLLGAAEQAQGTEADHAAPWCALQGGQIEHVLPDRTRVDCLTDTHAIEVDFAPKWAEAIGQALYYAAATGKRPGVLLLLRSPADARHLRRFAQAVQAWQLPVDLWTLPVYER